MTQQSGLTDDPLWFKDAIIYEVHIRGFQDSTNDGIGDIRGLISRLDYLADLGINAIWLLPFYPSPLKDGGYDIANYVDVHEHYGTLEDFKELLAAAHGRGIRVITELVLNHTSSDHPWFQAARRAPAGSPARQLYVWSDTPTRYEDARIIFKDFEPSNWSWDPIAKAYYWHRFYAHQPDLNFDNPAVHTAMFDVIDFWFGLGVDGVRLDAVPYLYEREGTSCENLPETHEFLRSLRAHIDSKFTNRMLLAEANQWPADAVDYFGAGNECHMNFQFPLMPRMFIALETEDSFPIVNILMRTPAIPPDCQWATFLRNHDELTLEMVTDEDRETMYRGYAAERAARLNLGIRRRLAPLLGARPKIELMNALLLSLPGSPVLYYGDEIGMGDNIYLGDRDGVRTPMQWSSDRNGGFSRANPQMLYLPVNIDPAYHYEAINVEAQQSNSASLLWWMKRLIAKRKEHRVFGRGSIDFVGGDNPRVLAFVRELDGETVLVVANLSRFVQCTRLNLSRFATMLPIEVFGRTRFPEIGEPPYVMSLGPYSFYWLSLTAPPTTAERPPIEVERSWTELLAGTRRALADILSAYATRQPWFRSKANVDRASVVDVLWAGGDAQFAIALLRLDYDHGSPETYVMPIAFAAEESAAPIIARVVVADSKTRGVLCDALVGDDVTRSLRLLEGAGVTLTQAASSGDHVLELLRLVEEGPKPEIEVARFLAARAPAYHGTPRLEGVLEYGRKPTAIGMLFERVSSQGDAWLLTQDALARYFDLVLADAHSTVPPRAPALWSERARTVLPHELMEPIGPYLDRVRLLGARTAELHLALASDASDPLFAPEPYDITHQQSIYGFVAAEVVRTFDRLRTALPALTTDDRAVAQDLLSRETALDRALVRVTRRRIDVVRIRIHGNYNLGQVLWTGDDFMIVNVESELGRSRRFKRNPLRDVAGMLTSLQYASARALVAGRARPDDLSRLAPWSRAWTEWVSGAFLGGYLERAKGQRFAPVTDAELDLLLGFFLLEKCIYEIAYELDHRPSWAGIPLRALLDLLSS